MIYRYDYIVCVVLRQAAVLRVNFGVGNQFGGGGGGGGKRGGGGVRGLPKT